MPSRPAPGVILLAVAAALLASIALAAVVAVAPSSGVVVALLTVVAAAGWAVRRDLARPLAIGIVALALVALVVGLAVAPLAAGIAASGAVLIAGHGRLRRALVAALPVAGAAVGVAVLALATAAWPALVGVAAIVGVIVVLAVREPAWALVPAIALVAFEGSIKILLEGETGAFGVSNRVVGAAAIDVALFAAVAGVLASDRLRTPRALWAGASRAERIAIALLGAWLALSVVQIALNTDLASGFKGFRLFQAYVAVALAAAVVAARPGRAGRAVLAIGFAVALYAAARVVVGPSDAEERYALSFASTTAYGDEVRAVGSFSGATGLSSYLTPLVVFSLVLAILVPRLRRASFAVAGLGLVAVLATYGRGPLVAIALGLAFALVFVLAARDVSRRRKLVAVALVAGALGAAFTALYVASLSSPVLRERAEGLIDPQGDVSLQMRFDGWADAVELVRERPLGRGLGSVGAVTDKQPDRYLVTDNSFLKVLVEQGILGGVLFLGGLLAAIAVLIRRLRRAAGGARALGLAALAGFVAFLCLALTGEYVEQPGKVVAWGLLGVAAAQAFRRPEAPA